MVQMMNQQLLPINLPKGAS